MSDFIKDLISVVLVSPLNELLVLKYSNYEQSKIISQPVYLNKRQIKFELGDTRLSAETLNDIKLRQDVKGLFDTLFDAVEEFQNRCTFDILLKTIHQHNAKKYEQENQIQHHETNSFELKHLVAGVIDFKSEANKVLLEATQKLNNLKSSWRLIRKLNGLEHELVNKWEQTRYTQATIAGENTENYLRNTCSKLVAKTEAEQLVASNIQAFLKLDIEKYTNMVSSWKERYTNEINDLESIILKKEKWILELKNTYEKHYEIFRSREVFINEYLEQKAEQDRWTKLQIRRIESAIRIQAWWRGVMVRKGFGSYRKKTKRSRKEKKAKH